MKMYVARDRWGGLGLFEYMPYEDGGYWYDGTEDRESCELLLPSNHFPEVTFENSPQEVELKLIER